MRFKGQKHSLRIPFNVNDGAATLKKAFFDAYRRRYGHVDETGATEIIGVRVAGFATTRTPDVARVSQPSTTADPEHARPAKSILRVPAVA
jgi:N-methylhydantoinase A